MPLRMRRSGRAVLSLAQIHSIFAKETYVNRSTWILIWLFVWSIEHFIFVYGPKAFVGVLVRPNFHINTVLHGIEFENIRWVYSIRMKYVTTVPCRKGLLIQRNAWTVDQHELTSPNVYNRRRFHCCSTLADVHMLQSMAVAFCMK